MARKKGYKHSETTKQKIKKSNVRYWKHHSRKGKDNGFFGKSHKISKWRKINQFGNKNPMFGKKHKFITKQKMRTTLRKHHIYLIENSPEIIEISVSKHRQLHARAYSYIYDKYGKEGIDDYMKWFDKNYGLKDK